MIQKQGHVFQNLRVSKTSFVASFVSHISIETAANFSITLILYYVSITVAQSESAKGLQPPLAIESLRKFNPKLQAFKHVLDFTCDKGRLEGAGQFNSSTGFLILAIWFFHKALKRYKISSKWR